MSDISGGPITLEGLAEIGSCKLPYSGFVRFGRHVINASTVCTTERSIASLTAPKSLMLIIHHLDFDFCTLPGP